MLGVAFDADELVRLAEEAQKAAPSAGTRSTLQTALLARASKALAAQEPEYAAMADKVRRALSSSHLIAVALAREGKPRVAALANADVKRALELARAAAAEFPNDPNEWSWAVLRAAYPEDAARIADALKGNELVRLERTLDARLSSPNTATALRQAWALEAAGKPEEARDVLKRSAADGVPLPFDVP
jgi:hypothetical protein